MLKMPEDYKNARAYDGNSGFSQLAPGGHICRIMYAKATTSRSGNPMLEVAFDIEEGSDDDGRFMKRFKELKQYNADAKWPNGGMFRTGLVNKGGMTSGFFKGLITAVEKSNSGYSLEENGFDETTLKNKLVGFVFGEEEYRGSDGQIRTAVKANYATSIENVRKGIPAPAKRVLKESKPQFVEASDEPLPWEV